MASIDRHGQAEDRRRSRVVVALLLLTSLTIVTLDAHDPSHSPLQPLRTAVGDVLGPVQSAVTNVVHPITSIPAHFGNVSGLRAQNQALQQRNDQLQAQLDAASANANRSTEVAGISRFADTAGFSVVGAQVVGVGPAQSFSQTVTIDAGTDQGVVPDLTVINADGLVGRVVAATHGTATVLLIVDGKSTVGGRLGDSMELGFLDGDSDLSGDGRLRLSLVDHTVSPRIGDPVVTWGSEHGAPYVPGVPIGVVTGVRSSPAELTQTAEVKPYVDFSSLDVVAVVTGTTHGRQTSTAGTTR